MKKKLFLFCSLSAIAVLFFACTHDVALPEDPVDTGEPCDSSIVYFENDVLPIFEAHCAFGGCHDAQTSEEGVQLDTYVNIVTTGKVKPFKPGNSEAYEQIIENKMPPSPYEPLTDGQKNIIEKWILQGAKNLTCTASGSCDTINVTYSGNILPILNNSCLSCHGASVYQDAGGDVNLSSYDAVKVPALDGRLYGSVNHDQDFVDMPLNLSKLPNCQIKQIKAWIDAGAPNN